MQIKKWLTRCTLGLSLTPLLYLILHAVYMIQNHPYFVTSFGRDKWSYLGAAVLLGLLFFAAIWAVYGFVRWLVVAPFIRMSNALKGVRKLKLACPKCGRILKGATTEMIGDTGVCPKCKSDFVIEQKECQVMNGEYKKVKGGVSNTIAWIFMVLEVMLIIGGLYGGGHKEQIAFFNNLKATVQSLIFVAGLNILGIGALILSLIVWRHHKNKKGKVTTIVAIAVIILNTFCNCKLIG